MSEKEENENKNSSANLILTRLWKNQNEEHIIYGVTLIHYFTWILFCAVYM